MGPRIERREPAAVPRDSEPEPAAQPAPKKPRPEPAPLSPLAKRALPSPFFTYKKAPTAPPPAATQSDEAAIRNALGKPVVKPMTSALEPAAPVATRFEAGKRIEALEAKHGQAEAELERSIRHWTGAAAALRKSSLDDAKRGLFREGLGGAVWHAERQASVAKALLRDLNADFDAAKFAYEGLLGRASGPGARRGSAAKPALAGDIGSTAERFAQRLARYDRSLDAVRSSGVIAPIIAASKGLAAGLHGRELDREDYQILDGMYQAGQVLDVPLGVRMERGALARGAQPAAPGADHRDAARDAARDNLFRARQYGTYDK